MDEHGNEAISAVVDDGFLAGDEEDDDYEDLYNDVNVGENFFQSVTKTDDVAIQEDERKADPPLPPQPVPAAVEEPKIERSEGGGDGGGDSRVSDKVEEVQKVEDSRDEVTPMPPGSGGAMRINLGQQPEQPPPINTTSIPSNPVTPGNGGGYVRPGPNMNGNTFGGGSTMLFVGDLHWWTTDADLEAELCKYGAVKEVRFFDEKASGKSKGYAQVEFFDPASATACKENMNGHVFNGRACVVAFASPFSIKRMGEAQMNRTAQGGGAAAQGGGGGGGLGPVRRGPIDGPTSNVTTTNKPIVGDTNSNSNNNNRGYDNNRGGYGRGNWGRGNNQGMGGGRGPTGPIRNRPGGMMGGRGGMMGNGFGGGPPMMPPQAMMGQGFDPTFGGPMGRMGGYGGFPGGPTPPFPGMMPSFPPVVAPHVNPAFFGRGMGMNGMGMMSGTGVEGMWQDPNMGSQWGGSEDHGGRVAESSYVEEEVSDRGGGGRPNVVKERERGEREWSGSSEREIPREEMSHDHQERQERRHPSREREKERETRERSRDRGRERHREERGERYVDHHHHNRYKERESEYDDDWDNNNRGRSSSSRTHSKSRLSQDEGQYYRSRDGDYSKRRRTSD